MREIHSTQQMVKTTDYAAYTLFAKSSPSTGAPGKTLTLDEYLATVASGRNLSPIGVTINQHFGRLEDFCAYFQRQSQQGSSTFERAREKLILSGHGRDWALAVVEVDPAELRFHAVSNTQWRKHRTEIRKYRSVHPEEAARMTDADIAATLNLAPYHEVLAFHSPNPVLATRSTIFSFQIPRGDGTGHDHYSVKVRANDIVIIETVGLAEQQLIIANDADPANYTATTIIIQ